MYCIFLKENKFWITTELIFVCAEESKQLGTGMLEH